jgi:6-phosphogluconolactonase (cycloisomerase 2 family)
MSDWPATGVASAPDFVVACGLGGVVQRWTLADGAPSLCQQIDCGGPVAPLAWRAEDETLYAALRGQPYALLRLERDRGGVLQVVERQPLAVDLAWIALDATRRGLLGASYAMHCIAWQRDSGVEILATDGPSHACIALGGGRLLLATETLGGSLLCLASDDAGAALHARSASRLRLAEAASPRHLACAGPWVFINNEAHARLDVCRYDAGANALHPMFSAALDWNDAEAPWYGDIRCSADGSRVWISERRLAQVHCLDVDVERGRVRASTALPAPATPRALARHGDWLVSCGETANALVVHRRQPDGVWREAARAPCAARPMWVEFLSGA